MIAGFSLLLKKTVLFCAGENKKVLKKQGGVT